MAITDNPCYKPTTYSQLPQMKVTTVAGRQGAEAFKMGPNSSVLLLDESGLLVWLVVTDGAGYKSTISPYDISPHKTEPSPDFKSFEERLMKLEGFMNELTGLPQED